MAIDGLGIDRRAAGASLKKQESVMKDFMAIAEGANKAIRLLSTGDVSTTLEITKASLSRKQEVHLVNCNSSGPELIQNFLLHFVDTLGYRVRPWTRTINAT